MVDRSLMQITEEEEQKMIARSRKKYEWDRVAWMKVEMDEAREEGRAEGLAEARAEGISIGEKRGRSVRNMENKIAKCHAISTGPAVRLSVC